MHINKLTQSKWASLSWKSMFTLFMAVLLTACSGSVKRIDTNEDVMLSDRWNDTDSRLVAEEMMSDMLTFPWFRDYNFNK
ncbi:MAG: penicillin-binding protein activator LpoB, partial [Gammaproteobacteria bacterium]|nr:penicillin-binding protein activator LpoB [Gammaproteobacteria bacterium]MBU2022565.1 penicillin-binding protein activator LpoB [Gammaproteobacteria bacterium]